MLGTPRLNFGSITFIIYMNDICNVSELLYTIMDADDTSVIMSGNDLESLIQSVNSELCLLNTWLKANKLSLNVNKTYYLIFHRARIKVDNDNSIRMNASIINSASHLKYLGVIIDSKLNWIPHITYVKNKISKGIGSGDYLNKNCLSNLYHTYIFPYLIYCIEVWGNTSHCHLLPLFLTQEKIIRLIKLLETFSSYRTYIQIIKYSSTQQSLLSQNWTFNV